MTPPIYSDDQPPKPEKQPGDEGTDYAVQRKIRIRIGDEDLIGVRRLDWSRYIGEVRRLEGKSSGWIAAASTLFGIAASLAVAAATVPGQFLTFSVLAMVCLFWALGCLLSHRQVNRQRQDAAEKLAREMEDAVIDQSGVKRAPADPFPPPAPST
jgi:Flp pilus assembly protein TadB